VGCVLEREGGGRQHAETEGVGAVGRAGEARWGGVRYSAVLAALGEHGLARGEGKWAGPRETVSGGGGKLI
jgi:hypothetical protein